MWHVLTRSCEERRDMSIQADFPLLSLSRLPIPCRVDLNPALGRLSTSPSYDSECDDKAIHSPEDRVSEEFPPIPGSIFGSMAWPRCGTAVVAGRAAAGGRAVGRPTDHRCARRTTNAGLHPRRAYRERYHSFRSARSRPTSSTPSSRQKTRASISTMASTGTRSKSPPTKTWRAIAFAALPPLPSSW